jgi:CRISPR system Cascade subunit CasA
MNDNGFRTPQLSPRAEPHNASGSHASRFNLVDCPWIQVRLMDGTVGCESLSGVFAHASDIREIAGELPTQDFAILRLLLAIVQRSVLTDPSFAEETDPAQLWSSLWQADGLPDAAINAYLTRWRHRFNLFDDHAPFMQVAGLRTAKDEVSPVAKIIAEVPDGSPFFTTRCGAAVASLSLAEAARWLVHVHAFDTAGIKSGVVGDPDVKGGKSYSTGRPGWAGCLGGVVVVGDDLRSMLLLNLDLSAGEFDRYHLASRDDLPAWERDPARPGNSGRQPTGPVDLFTWQTRRARLVRTDDMVTGAVLTNGDKLEPQNRQSFEPLTGWRRSSAQEKKLGLPKVYMPAEHRSDRAMWQALDALLPSASADYLEGAAFLPPRIIFWLGHLMDEDADGVLDPDAPLLVRGVGVNYGTQNAVITDIIDDRLNLHRALLTQAGVPLVNLAKACVKETADAVFWLGLFAANLHVASGGDAQGTDGPANRAKELAYFSLDRDFRRWLANLIPPGGEDETLDDFAQERREEWRKQARHNIAAVAAQLVAEAPPQAFTGHQDKTGWMTAGKAEAIFWAQLRKILPLAVDASAPLLMPVKASSTAGVDGDLAVGIASSDLFPRKESALND